MREIAIKVLIYAVSIVAVAYILPGITVVQDDIISVLIVGLVIGIVDTFIKPIVKFLSCPLMLLTFGLFAFVINGLMLQIADWLLGNTLNIDNFLWAMLGGFIMAIISAILERVFLSGSTKSKKRR